MGSPIDVLIVEDNPADAKITKLILQASGIDHRSTVVEDGQQALAFLNRDSPYLRAPTPSLVLLDLGLPRIDGVAVLRQLAGNRAASREILGVIVISGIEDPSTWENARRLGADLVLKKSDLSSDIESSGRYLRMIWDGMLAKALRDRTKSK